MKIYHRHHFWMTIGIASITTVSCIGNGYYCMAQGTDKFTTFVLKDGTIAFVSDRNDTGNDNREIYLVNTADTRQKRLTYNAGFDGSPSFNLNGSKIAFWSNRDGNAEIYTMNLDGSKQTRLTHNSFWDGTPSFSPDGHRLVFVSDRANPSARFEIYTMNTDGSNQKRLSSALGSVESPRFSPNGCKIIYWGVGKTLGNHGPYIYLMNADGSHVQRLTFGQEPSFSPDGRCIVFCQQATIRILTFANNGERRISAPLAFGSYPTFSPDGKAIAFYSKNPLKNVPDTEDLNLLSDNKDESKGGKQPRFDIYTVGVDGKGIKKLTKGTGNNVNPTWARSILKN